MLALALHVANPQLLTVTETIRWDAKAMATEFIDMTLWDALFAAAQSAALASRKEAPSLVPGTRSHPADIFHPN